MKRSRDDGQQPRQQQEEQQQEQQLQLQLQVQCGMTMRSSFHERRQQRRTTRKLIMVSSYLLALGSIWLTTSSSSSHLVDAERLLYTTTASSSSLKTQTTPFLLTTRQQLRGGDSKHDKNNNNDNNNDHDDDDDDTQDDHRQFMSAWRKDWLWATGALFRLNEHTLAEALRDTTLSTKNPTNGRGGALLVKKQRRTSSSKSTTTTTSSSSTSSTAQLSSSGGSSNGNPHLSPFDTSRVSPLDKRLLVDDDDNDEKKNATNMNKTNAAANSLWWANVWAQQILDADTSNNIDYNNVDNHIHAKNKSQANLENHNQPTKAAVAAVTTNGNDKKDQATKQYQQQQQQQQQQAATNKEHEDNATAILSKEHDKKKKNNDKSKVKEKDTNSVSNAAADAETTGVALVQTTRVVSPYASSGYWRAIDQVASLGLATFHPAFRVSLRLRAARKATARVTGLHGVLSGKGRLHQQQPRRLLLSSNGRRRQHDDDIVPLDEEDLGMIRRRIAAIDRARETLERAAAAEAEAKRQMRWTWLFGKNDEEEDNDNVEAAAAKKADVEQTLVTMDSEVAGTEMNATSQLAAQPLVATKKSREEEKQEEKRRKERAKEEEKEEKRRREKAQQEELEEKRRIELEKEEEKEERRRRNLVMAIDKQILEGQLKLQELQCEKDALQRRPNPLWNYTTETQDGEETHTRTFNFPPPELVEEYLEVLFWSGRLVKLNHTHLWKSAAELEDEDDDETIGDDLLTPSGDAYKLYEKSRRQTQQQQRQQQQQPRQQRLPGDEYRRGNGGGGSWLLRQTIGKGGSLGEKIGETAETAAYKGVCQALMGVLARGLSALHGVNILAYSDIRLFMEQSPDLPPLGGILIPGSGVAGSNYAQQALKDVMRRGARKNKRRKQNRLSDNAGIQRDAIVETLLSHCQISAPLLKLFPLAWQRALLGNIITLVAAVVSDFCEGVQFQILGHQLSFLFKPITESDVVQHLSLSGHGFNHRRARPDQFEAAVRATADEINGNLKFLDRWHERALGGGMLRAQIADLIARLVLTLFDEVLCGARMDLWSAQAGGPRLVAGLEYRTTPSDMDTEL